MNAQTFRRLLPTFFTLGMLLCFLLQSTACTMTVGNECRTLEDCPS